MREVAEAHVRIRGDTSSVEGDIRSGMGQAIGSFAKKGAVAVGAGIGAGVLGGMRSTFLLNDAKLPLAQVAKGEGLEIAKQVTDEMISQFGLTGPDASAAVFTALSAGVDPKQLLTEMEVVGTAAIGLGLDAERSSNIAALGWQAFGETAESMFAKIATASGDALGDSGTFADVLPIASSTAASIGVHSEEVMSLLTQSSKATQDLNRSATQSDAFFRELANTTSGVGEKFTEIAGISFKDFVAEGGTTVDALMMLDGQAASTGLTIAEMFSSSEAKQFATEAVDNMDEVIARTDATADASFGKIDELYKNQRRSAAQLFAEIKGKLTVGFAQLAERVLPVVLNGLEHVGAAIQSFVDGGGIERLSALLQRFAGFFQPVIGALAGFFQIVTNDVAALGATVAVSLGGGSPVQKFALFVRGTVIPTVERLISAFRDALPTIRRIAERGFRVLAENGPVVAAALGGIVAAVAGAKLAPLLRFSTILTKVGPIIAAVSSPVVLVAVALASLAAGAVWAYRNVDQFRIVADTVWQWIQTTGIPVLEQLVGRFVDWLVPAVQDLATKIVEFLLPHLRTFGQFITETAIPVVQELSTRFVEWLIPALQDLSAFIVDDVVPAVQAFIERVADILMPTVVALAAFVTGSLVPALSTVAAFIISDVVPVLMTMWGVFKDNVIPVVADVVAAFLEHVLPAIGDVAEFFTGTLIPAVLDFAGFLLDNVLPAILDLIGLGFDILKPIVEAAGETFEAFGGIASGVISGITDFVTGLIDNIRSLIDWLSRVPGAGLVGDAAGFLTPFAEGGMVTGPTRALIGEAGPELVLPLTQPGRIADLMADFGGPVLAAVGAAAGRGTAGAAAGNTTTNQFEVRAIDPWGTANEIYRMLDDDLAGAGR